MIRPPLLREGDTIGVVSPASPVAALRPRRFERGLRNLQEMGFRVRAAKNAGAIKGHTAGTVEQRVADLHGMFADEEVRAIMCSIGGFNSNQLLDQLDYDLIRRNPKILTGYSDITALLLAIHEMTGLVTFLGPSLMVQFGEHGGPHPYTERWLRRTMMSAEPPGVVEPSGVVIHERLEWDEEDDRPRREEPHEGPKTLKPGAAEGPIVAGNLSTLVLLAGTSHLPDLDGAVLCVELSDDEPAEWADRFLFQLRHMGAFEKVAALVVGRAHPDSGFTEEDSFEEILRNATAGQALPVATGFDFGHTDPMFTLPNGARTRVDFGEQATLELLESGVSKS